MRSGSIAIGDFNGDGRPDFVLSSQRGIDALLNLGGGNFGEPILSPLGWGVATKQVGCNPAPQIR
jgi:FG-GAP-like repeat